MLFVIVGLLVRSGALKRPGIVTGVFAIGYGAARISLRILSRAGRAAWLFMGRPDDGNAVVAFH